MDHFLSGAPSKACTCIDGVIAGTFTKAMNQVLEAAPLLLVLGYGELDKERLRADFPTLRGWLETATGENCYALGDLVNYLAYGGPAPDEELVSSTDPSAIWRRVETLEASTGYSWGTHSSAKDAQRSHRRTFHDRSLMASDLRPLRRASSHAGFPIAPNAGCRRENVREVAP